MTSLSVLLAALGLAAIAWHRNRAALRAEIERDEWRNVAREYRNSTASVKHGVQCYVVNRLTSDGFKLHDERCALCRQYDAANEGTK